MGLLDSLIKSSVQKTLIHVGGDVLETAVNAYSQSQSEKENPKIRDIAVPRSSEDYRGMNVKDAENELFAYCFTDIQLQPKKDLINGWLTKDGTIEYITIAGKPDFRKRAKFKAYERVVIVYHTFRDAK